MVSEIESEEFEDVMDGEFDEAVVEDAGREAAVSVASPMRSLAARRAIEARRELKELDEDLNYLEFEDED